jgi:hypothetical protein
MKTIPATARQPPGAVLWRAWGLQGALRAARLCDENTETVIEKKSTEKH